jgi:hypothetical protein
LIVEPGERGLARFAEPAGIRPSANVPDRNKKVRGIEVAWLDRARISAVAVAMAARPTEISSRFDLLGESAREYVL